MLEHAARFLDQNVCGLVQTQVSEMLPDESKYVPLSAGKNRRVCGRYKILTALVISIFIIVVVSVVVMA